MARYGGEEFTLLCESSDADQAVEVLSRLRRVTPLGQTFSGGVATWDGTETSDELVARADVALYAAKTGGRDRVAAAESPGELGPDRHRPGTGTILDDLRRPLTR